MTAVGARMPGGLCSRRVGWAQAWLRGGWRHCRQWRRGQRRRGGRGIGALLGPLVKQRLVDPLDEVTGHDAAGSKWGGVQLLAQGERYKRRHHQKEQGELLR